MLAQRLEPGRVWQSGSSQIGPVTVALVDVSVAGDRIQGVTRYAVGGRGWRQRWELWERSDQQLQALLAGVGLRLASVEGTWITATR